MQVFYAHTSANRPKSEREPLTDHLADVAELAGINADALVARTWGKLLGDWHDLGKYSNALQARPNASDPDAGEDEQSLSRVDHATFGARHAVTALDAHAGQIVAFCIAGHHFGLPDATSDDVARECSTLAHRSNEKLYTRVQPVNANIDPPPMLRFPLKRSAKQGFDVSFFTRMLFSCLVDADRTATEAFCDSARSAERPQSKPTVTMMRDELITFLERKAGQAEPTPVDRQRAIVLGDCIAAAERTPGLFSLNVPTGGGKTLSSLAFALRHAAVHGLRRVVVAIPFTSIIEQTAAVYRDALGGLASLGLVEHHSGIDPKRHTRENQMGAENWDAPLAVSTNVQLCESLFAVDTTSCRKLHRLARSVIVLDGAQTIPVDLLRPPLAALKELVDNYGCSVVLSTATQPALTRRKDKFEIGIDPQAVRPIIADELALHAARKRVEVRRLAKLSDEELAVRFAGEPSALCVVNSRPHAAKIFEAIVVRVSDDGSYLLSTFLCPRHRRERLATICHRLADGKPCRLVSTQLTEEGVDVDFPAVYRAPAGFDSIAQAAGRCNRRPSRRRPRLPFDTESPPPPGLLRDRANRIRTHRLAPRPAPPRRLRGLLPTVLLDATASVGQAQRDAVTLRRVARQNAELQIPHRRK